MARGFYEKLRFINQYKQLIFEDDQWVWKQLSFEVREGVAYIDFVFRTDVKGYYASIQHEVLLNICRQYIQDPFILKLIRQYLRHHVYNGGIYRTIRKGISLGCPLSPLMGALCLKPLDDAMEKEGLFYFRYMDGWVVLSPTPWKLRKAIVTVNQCLNDLGFEKHPDKTFIGRTSKGNTSAFLSYFFLFQLKGHQVSKFAQTVGFSYLNLSL